MDICRRLSNEITSLTSASSAAEHRRHLQSIVDLLEGHGVPSTVDQICPALWGDLGLSLLSLAHRQLSRAFPLSASSFREERHAFPPYLSSSTREKGRKLKLVALSPNDALLIQNIFKYILDSPHIRLLSSSCPCKDLSKDTNEDTVTRERGFIASEDGDTSSGKRQSRNSRSFFSSEEDFPDEFSSACNPNNERSDRRSPSSLLEKIPFYVSANSPLQQRRKRKRIEDIVRSLLSLLIRCARIRLSLPSMESPQLRFLPVGDVRSSILLSSRRLLSGRQFYRISLVVAQQRCELVEKYILQEKKRFSQQNLHACRGGRQREKDEEEERHEGEWRGQDERWEACFLTVLQQILRNEDYVKALPYDLLRFLLSNLFGLFFSSPRKCLLISSSLLSHPSVGSFLPSLAMPSMTSLLSLLEGLLYPEVATRPEAFPIVDLEPRFSAEDARITSVALHALLRLSLKFPLVLRKLFFFSSSRSPPAQPRDRSSPCKPCTLLQGSHGCSHPTGLEGDTHPGGEEERVFKRPGMSKEISDVRTSSLLRTHTPTFIPFERGPSRAPERLRGEEGENEEMIRHIGKEWTSSRRAVNTSSLSVAGMTIGENKKRDEEIFLTDREERYLSDNESGQPLVVLVLCGLLQDDVWECLDDLSRWNSLLLVRLVLLLARGTTPSDLLPRVVGATECMARLFSSLLRVIPPFFAAVHSHGAAVTLEDRSSFSSTILTHTEQLLNAIGGLRLRMTAGLFADADEDLLNPRQVSGSSVWYMRVVLLDLLVQVLWESSNLHPVLVMPRGSLSPQRRRRSRFSSPRCCSASTLEEKRNKKEPHSDIGATTTHSLHSDKTGSELHRRLSTGGDSRHKLSEAQNTHPSRLDGLSQGREKLPEGSSTDPHAERSKPPAYRTSLEDLQQLPSQLPKATSLPRGGDEEKSYDEKRVDIESGLGPSPEPKELLINYVLAKLEGSSERIHKQLWCLVVVRVCESVGIEFASSTCEEDLTLLGSLFSRLTDILLQDLPLLSGVSVQCNRASRVTDVLASVACLCQALSSILILPFYPYLLSLREESSSMVQCLQAARTSRRQHLRATSSISSETENLSADNYDRKHERREELSQRQKSTALFDTAGEGLSSTLEYTSSSPSNQEMSEDSGMRREGSVRDLPLCEKDGYPWQVPLLGSQLFNSAPIVCTLKCGLPSWLGVVELPPVSARGPELSEQTGSFLLLVVLQHAGFLLDCLLSQKRSLERSLAGVSTDCRFSLSFSPSFVFTSYCRLIQALFLRLPASSTKPAASYLLRPPFVPSSVNDYQNGFLPMASTSTLSVPSCPSSPSYLSASTQSSLASPLPSVDYAEESFLLSDRFSSQPPSAFPQARGLGVCLPALISPTLFPPCLWLIEVLSVMWLQHGSGVPPLKTLGVIEYLLPHALFGRESLGQLSHPREERISLQSVRQQQQAHPVAFLWTSTSPTSSQHFGGGGGTSSHSADVSLSMHVVILLFLRNISVHSRMKSGGDFATGRPPYRSSKVVGGHLAGQSGHHHSKFCDLPFVRASCPSSTPLLLTKRPALAAAAAPVCDACEECDVGGRLLLPAWTWPSFSGVYTDRFIRLLPFFMNAFSFLASSDYVATLSSASCLPASNVSSGSSHSDSSASPCLLTVDPSHAMCPNDALKPTFLPLSIPLQSNWHLELKMTDVWRLLRLFPLSYAPLLSECSTLYLDFEVGLTHPVNLSFPSSGCDKQRNERRSLPEGVCPRKDAFSSEKQIFRRTPEVYGEPLTTAAGSLSPFLSIQVIQLCHRTHVAAALRLLSLIQTSFRRGRQSLAFRPMSSRGSLSTLGVGDTGGKPLMSGEVSPADEEMPSPSACHEGFTAAHSAPTLEITTGVVPCSLGNLSIVHAGCMFLASLRMTLPVLPAEMWLVPLTRLRYVGLRHQAAASHSRPSSGCDPGVGECLSRRNPEEPDCCVNTREELSTKRADAQTEDDSLTLPSPCSAACVTWRTMEALLVFLNRQIGAAGEVRDHFSSPERQACSEDRRAANTSESHPVYASDRGLVEGTKLRVIEGSLDERERNYEQAQKWEHLTQSRGSTTGHPLGIRQQGPRSLLRPSEQTPQEFHAAVHDVHEFDRLKNESADLPNRQAIDSEREVFWQLLIDVCSLLQEEGLPGPAICTCSSRLIAGSAVGGCDCGYMHTANRPGHAVSSHRKRNSLVENALGSDFGSCESSANVKVSGGDDSDDSCRECSKIQKMGEEFNTSSRVDPSFSGEACWRLFPLSTSPNLLPLLLHLAHSLVVRLVCGTTGSPRSLFYESTDSAGRRSRPELSLLHRSATNKESGVGAYRSASERLSDSSAFPSSPGLDAAEETDVGMKVKWSPVGSQLTGELAWDDDTRSLKQRVGGDTRLSDISSTRGRFVVKQVRGEISRMRGLHSEMAVDCHTTTLSLSRAEREGMMPDSERVDDMQRRAGPVENASASTQFFTAEIRSDAPSALRTVDASNIAQPSSATSGSRGSSQYNRESPLSSREDQATVCDQHETRFFPTPLNVLRLLVSSISTFTSASPVVHQCPIGHRHGFDSDGGERGLSPTRATADVTVENLEGCKKPSGPGDYLNSSAPQQEASGNREVWTPADTVCGGTLPCSPSPQSLWATFLTLLHYLVTGDMPPSYERPGTLSRTLGVGLLDRRHSVESRSVQLSDGSSCRRGSGDRPSREDTESVFECANRMQEQLGYVWTAEGPFGLFCWCWRGDNALASVSHSPSRKEAAHNTRGTGKIQVRRSLVLMQAVVTIAASESMRALLQPAFLSWITSFSAYLLVSLPGYAASIASMLLTVLRCLSRLYSLADTLDKSEISSLHPNMPSSVGSVGNQIDNRFSSPSPETPSSPVTSRSSSAVSPDGRIPLHEDQQPRSSDFANSSGRMSLASVLCQAFFIPVSCPGAEQQMPASEKRHPASQVPGFKSFLNRAEEAGSILGAIVLLLAETHDPGQTTECCDIPTLALISQLLSEALFLARREPHALGQTAVDALASCALYRNAALLAGADLADGSDEDADEVRSKDHSSQETEEPLEPSTGRATSPGTRRAGHLDLQEGQESLLENTQINRSHEMPLSCTRQKCDTVIEELSVRIAPFAVASLLEAFDQKQVLHDLGSSVKSLLNTFQSQLSSYAVDFIRASKDSAELQPSSPPLSSSLFYSPRHRQLLEKPSVKPLARSVWTPSSDAGGVEFPRKGAPEELGPVVNWRRAYVPNRHVALITALASGAVAFPGATGEVLWSLLQAACLPEVAFALLPRETSRTRAVTPSESSCSLFPNAPSSSPLDTDTGNPPSTPTDQQHLSRLADSSRPSETVFAEPPPTRDDVHEASLGSFVRSSVYTLAWPVIGTLLHALHLMALCQGFTSLRHLTTTHVHFFLTRWIASRQLLTKTTRPTPFLEGHRQHEKGLLEHEESLPASQVMTSRDHGNAPEYRVGNWLLPCWPWHLLHTTDLRTEKSLRQQATTSMWYIRRATTSSQEMTTCQTRKEEETQQACKGDSTDKATTAHERLRQNQEDEEVAELPRGARAILRHHSTTLLAACILQRLEVPESIQLARDAAGLKAEKLLDQRSSFFASLLMVYSMNPEIASYLDQLRHSDRLSQVAANGMQYILPAIARLHVDFAGCTNVELSFSDAYAALSAVFFSPSSSSEPPSPAAVQKGSQTRCSSQGLMGGQLSGQDPIQSAELDRLDNRGSEPAAERAAPLLRHRPSQESRGVLPYSTTSEFMQVHFFTFIMGLEYLLVHSRWCPSGAGEVELGDYRQICEAVHFLGFHRFFPRLAQLPDVAAVHRFPVSFIQQQFSLLLEATVAVVPVVGSSSVLLHLYLLFLLRILGGRLVSQAPSQFPWLTIGLEVSVTPTSVAEAVSDCFPLEPARNSGLSESGRRGSMSPLRGSSEQNETESRKRVLPPTSARTRIRPESRTRSREPDGTWQEGHAVAEAATREEKKFGQLALTAFLAVVAAAPPDIVRQAICGPAQGPLDSASRCGKGLSDMGGYRVRMGSSSSSDPVPLSHLPSFLSPFHSLRDSIPSNSSQRSALVAAHGALSPAPLLETLVSAIVERYGNWQTLYLSLSATAAMQLSSPSTLSRSSAWPQADSRLDLPAGVNPFVGKGTLKKSTSVDTTSPYQLQPGALRRRDETGQGTEPFRKEALMETGANVSGVDVQLPTPETPFRGDKRVGKLTGKDLLSFCPLFCLLRAVLLRLCEGAALCRGSVAGRGTDGKCSDTAEVDSVRICTSDQEQTLNVRDISETARDEEGPTRDTAAELRKDRAGGLSEHGVREDGSHGRQLKRKRVGKDTAPEGQISNKKALSKAGRCVTGQRRRSSSDASSDVAVADSQNAVQAKTMDGPRSREECRRSTGSTGRQSSPPSQHAASLVVDCLGMAIAPVFIVRPVLVEEAQEALDLLAVAAAAALFSEASSSRGCVRAATPNRSCMHTTATQCPKTRMEDRPDFAGARGATAAVSHALSRVARLLPFGCGAEWIMNCSHASLLKTPTEVSITSDHAPFAVNVPTRMWPSSPASAKGTSGSDRTAQRRGGCSDTTAVPKGAACLSAGQAETFIHTQMGFDSPPFQDSEDSLKNTDETGETSEAALMSQPFASLEVSACRTAFCRGRATLGRDREDLQSGSRPVTSGGFESSRGLYRPFRGVASSAAEALVASITSDRERRLRLVLLALAGCHLDGPMPREPAAGEQGAAPSVAAVGSGKVFAAKEQFTHKMHTLEKRRAVCLEWGAADEPRSEETDLASISHTTTYLLLQVCASRSISHETRLVASALLPVLPPTGFTKLREVLPIQDIRHDQAVAGAAAARKLLISMRDADSSDSLDSRIRRSTRACTDAVGWQAGACEESRRLGEPRSKGAMTTKHRKWEPQPCEMFMVVALVGATSALCRVECSHLVRALAMLAIQCLRPLSTECRHAGDLGGDSTKPTSDSRECTKETKQSIQGTARMVPSGISSESQLNEDLGDEQAQDVEQLMQLLNKTGSSLASLLSVAGVMVRGKDSVPLLDLLCSDVKRRLGLKETLPGDTSLAAFFRNASVWSLTDACAAPPAPVGSPTDKPSVSTAGQTGVFVGDSREWICRVAACLLLFLDLRARDPSSPQECVGQDEGDGVGRRPHSGGPQNCSVQACPRESTVSYLKPYPSVFACFVPLAFYSATFAQSTVPALLLCVLETSPGSAQALADALNGYVFRPFSAELMTDFARAGSPDENDDTYTPSESGFTRTGGISPTPLDRPAAQTPAETKTVPHCGSCRHGKRPGKAATEPGAVSGAAAAAGTCLKSLQFMRIYATRLAGGAAPAILRARRKPEARGDGEQSRSTEVWPNGKPAPSEPGVHQQSKSHCVDDASGVCTTTSKVRAGLWSLWEAPLEQEVSASTRAAPSHVSSAGCASAECQSKNLAVSGSGTLGGKARLRHVLREGLGGNILEAFASFWESLDLQSAAAAALLLGCSADALLLAEQQLDKLHPDEAPHDALSVVSQMWQQCQLQSMPQTSFIRILQRIMAGRGASTTLAAATVDKAKRCRGSGKAASSLTTSSGDRGSVEGAWAGQGFRGPQTANVDFSEMRSEDEHLFNELQKMLQTTFRPASSAALLTPAGPAPLLQLVCHALVSANDEEGTAVAECLSTWHTPEFLLQKAILRRDQLSVLSFHEVQLQDLMGRRARLQGVDGDPNQFTSVPPIHRLDHLFSCKILDSARTLGALGLVTVQHRLLSCLGASGRQSGNPGPKVANRRAFVASCIDDAVPYALDAIRCRGRRRDNSLGGRMACYEDAADGPHSHWLESRYECLWRLNYWEADSLDAAGERIDLLGAGSPPSGCGIPRRDLFNGCIYDTLSLIHSAAVWENEPTKLPHMRQGSMPPRFSRSVSSKELPNSGHFCGSPRPLQGDFSRVLEIANRLKAIEISRRSVSVALHRLQDPQLLGSQLEEKPSCFHGGAGTTPAQLLRGCVELTMARDLKLAAELNLWRIYDAMGPCTPDLAFPRLQEHWANKIEEGKDGCWCVSDPPLAVVEPYLALQIAILQASVPNQPCPSYASTVTPAEDARGISSGNVYEEGQSESAVARRCENHRHAVARHLLLLGRLARTQNEPHRSLQYLLQAEAQLLEIRKREERIWQALRERVAEAWERAPFMNSTVNAGAKDPSSRLASLLLALSPSVGWPSGGSFCDIAGVAPSNTAALSHSRKTAPLVFPSLATDLYLVQWELAKSLYAAGDTNASLNIACRICRPKNWPLPLLKDAGEGRFSASANLHIPGDPDSGQPKAEAVKSLVCPGHESRIEQDSGIELSSFRARLHQAGHERDAAFRLQEFRSAVIDALCSCGEWQFTGRWTTESRVRQQFFNLAFRIAPPGGRLDPTMRLATLVDDQLQAYSDYKHSVATLVMEDLRREEKSELELLQKQANEAAQDLGKKQHERCVQHIDMLRRQLDLEGEQLRQHRERARWAAEAVSLYAACLYYPNVPSSSKITSRLLSLWLEWGEELPEVNKGVEEHLVAPFLSFHRVVREDGHRDLRAPCYIEREQAAQGTMHSTYDATSRRSGETPAAMPPDLRHLLPFVHQIASRLGDPEDSPFQKTLRRLLVTIATQYPFQCLYQIVAIRNGRRIPKGHKGSDRYTFQEDKVKAAQVILNMIGASSNALKLIVSSVEVLVDFYGELCLLDFEADAHELQKQQRNLPLIHRGTAGSTRTPLEPQDQMTRLPSYSKLLQVAHLLPIPTAELPREGLVAFNPPPEVQDCAHATWRLGEYIRTIHPCCFASSPGDPLRMRVKLVGSGITKPKVLTIWDHCGRTHRQCCKGREDVRQDRVAQQLFAMINQVFQETPLAIQHNLYLRTYTVVPLSPAFGILEWVSGTITLGRYLVGSEDSNDRGAHALYRPQDWTSARCRQRLRAARERDTPAARSAPSDETSKPPNLSRVANLTAAFDEICAHFKPVLHYFFLERFPAADIWYYKQQRYRRTLAVSSIVAYIVGLGDRHTNNILLDINTGDVIHIDFGVMFEQGKLLAVPELVPFRLTRDIVDGLGCLGVTGPFKRDCETTMKILRRVAPLVVSIVEVFVFDPLYRWCLDPRKLLYQQRQKHVDARGADRKSVQRAPKNSRGRRGEPAMVDSASSEDGWQYWRKSHERPQAATEDAPLVDDVLTRTAGNRNAKRAVLMVRRKLDGYEEGEIAQLNVPAHVARLLNAAQDRTALAQMFVGWAPWL